MVILRVAFVAVVCTAACKPDISDRVSLINGPRILALRSDPAEVPLSVATPSQPVSYTALVVDESGGSVAGAIDWALCSARRPVAEIEPVSRLCDQVSNAFLSHFAYGAIASTNVPLASCNLFGPENPPPVDAGTPRAADPDPTGGYFQPVRAFFANGATTTIAIGFTRIDCGVANASTDNTNDYDAHYHLNGNPIISNTVVTAVNAVALPSPAGLGAAPFAVAGAATIDLRLEWPMCPAIDVCKDSVCGPDESVADCSVDCANPVPCGGAERYRYYDFERFAMVDRRETISVAWYTTTGSYDFDSSGRDEGDYTPVSPSNPNAFTANRLAVPSHAGKVTAWAVLTDSRGGVTWQTFAFDVQ